MSIITPALLRDIDRAYFWLAEGGQACVCGEQCHRHVSYWHEGTGGHRAALTITSNPN